LYFQVLDNKKDCYGYFYNGSLYKSGLPQKANKTWRWTPNLDRDDAAFAYLYCGGKELEQACPSEFLEDFQNASNKLRAFLRTFEIAKVPLDDCCFYDLAPDRFLLEYFSLKNIITQHVFETVKKPANYSFLAELDRLLINISQQELNIDRDQFGKLYHLPSARSFFKTIKKRKKTVDYNLFGTKTGRLATLPNSFPILTMKKELRSILRPKNDWFVELDFNAAELRTLLALSGKEQPEEDLHLWNAKNVYGGTTTREEAKQRVFAWLYNPDSNDYLSSRAYERESVVSRHFNGQQVTTFFSREIPADKHHALNYTIQSTASDMFLKRVIEIDKLIRNRKSQVAFLLHDALVIDFSMEDKEMLKEILETFSQTDLGRFKVNVRAGENLGELKELSWKQS